MRNHDKMYDTFTITNDRKVSMNATKPFAQRLGEAILMFLDEDNVCKIYHEDCNVYCIEYGHDEEHREYWGGPTLTWLTDEEYGDILAARDAVEGRESEEEYNNDDDR